MGYIGSKPANKPITSADIEDSIIVAADLAANSVDSSELVDGGIDTSHLSADAVTAAKLADDAVVTANIVDLNVTTAKIAADAITGAKIADDAIGAEHIDDNAIGLAAMAGGTDGNIISYDASGNPVAIATGSDGEVLTSAGAGQPPAFEAVAAGGQYQILATTYDSTTTGSLALTGAGFEPKFIYLWYNIGSWVAGRVGVGMADGSGDFDQYSFNDGNMQTSDSWKFTRGNILDNIYSSSNYSYLEVASFDADGVTFTKSKYSSPSGTIAIQVACFG